MFETALNNTNFYFDESYSLQLLTPPLNLYIWSKMPGPSLIISPSPYDELRKIKIFKTTFKKLSILSKFWKWRIWQWVSGEEGHLICVMLFVSLWRIAYENLYVTRRLDEIQKSNYIVTLFSKQIFVWMNH